MLNLSGGAIARDCFEFVAVLPGIPNRAAALEVGSMIGERLALPYLIAGQKHCR